MTNLKVSINIYQNLSISIHIYKRYLYISINDGLSIATFDYQRGLAQYWVLLKLDGQKYQAEPAVTAVPLGLFCSYPISQTLQGRSL